MNSSAPESAVIDWLRAGGPAPVSARLRQSPEDFFVNEILGFEPDNAGEHDLLQIEKHNTNTEWLARQLARFAGIESRDVGYSGLKDRNARTRQWFSVRRPSGLGTDWSTFDLDNIRILEVARNSRKLRHGAHTGNEFRIVLRDIVGELGDLEQRLQRTRSVGAPNYFGEQRFGHNGRNLELARQFFSGKRLPREKRAFAISAARSWLFNHQLQEQVRDGSWTRLSIGDTAALDGTGSVFRVEAVDDELQRRLDMQDLHPTAVLWGKPSARSGVSSTAQNLAQRFPDLQAGLERHADMAQRATRLNASSLEWALEGNTLTLSFRLARGCYATALIREIANCTERSLEAATDGETTTAPANAGDRLTAPG